MLTRTYAGGIILGALCLISYACGGPGRPTVGTVTLGVDRVNAPLGAPLEFNIRFDLAPDLAPLTEDYRVLLHILGSDEELLWAEDHEPPVPTTQWQPNETVEYKHRIQVPMYPYVGEALIAVGLYSYRTGERLPLAGEDLGQMSYQVGTITLAPQPESSFLVYENGWHSAEFASDGRNDWRWTSGRAVLSVRNPMADAVFSFELDARPDMFEEPQNLSVLVGEEIVYEQVLDSNDRTYITQEISRDELGTEEIVELVLTVDQTFSPASRGGAPEDTRQLGVRVFYTYFESR